MNQREIEAIRKMTVKVRNDKLDNYDENRNKHKNLVETTYSHRITSIDES